MPGACDHLPTSPLPALADRLPVGPPLGTGPPTKAELLAYYPAKCTWQELKAVVSAGDLRLLKRDPNLNRRYAAFFRGLATPSSDGADAFFRSGTKAGARGSSRSMAPSVRFRVAIVSDSGYGSADADDVIGQ